MSDDQESGTPGPFNLPSMSDLSDESEFDDPIAFSPIGFDASQLRAQPIVKRESAPIPVPAVGDSNHLSDAEIDIVLYIERHHATNGEAPTNKQLMERFRGINQKWLDDFGANPLVLKSMGARGIIFPAAGDVLTQRQMAAVAAMLAYTDRRSDGKKLQDIGVTSREWAGWLQDEYFANYVNSRTERLLRNTTFEAHLGTIKGIRNGNTASIKLHHEMTGRYNPDQENAVNLRMLLGSFIEVIQRYVSDPIVLHKIARDLTTIATNEAPNQIQGRVVR